MIKWFSWKPFSKSHVGRPLKRVFSNITFTMSTHTHIHNTALVLVFAQKSLHNLQNEKVSIQNVQLSSKTSCHPWWNFFTQYFYECTSLSPYLPVTISMTTVTFQCSSNTPAPIPGHWPPSKCNYQPHPPTFGKDLPKRTVFFIPSLMKQAQTWKRYIYFPN